LTRTEIIKQVSEDSRYKIFCKEIGGNLSDDLFQEYILRLLSMRDEAIEKINNIDFYTVRTLMNMVRNKYDPFFKTFKQVYDDIDELPERIEVEVDKEKLHFIIEDELRIIESEYKGKYPYSVQLFRAYRNNNFNFRKTQRETGILYTSCFQTLKQVKERIKKRLDD
jgi:hypothetical protein